MMFADVCSPRLQCKVGKAIIQLLPIPVMNHFCRRQWAAKVLLHHVAMFKDTSTISEDGAVSLRSDTMLKGGALQSDPDFSSTRFRAESLRFLSAPVLDSTRLAVVFHGWPPFRQYTQQLPLKAISHGA